MRAPEMASRRLVRSAEINSDDWRDCAGNPTSNWFRVDWCITRKMKEAELARVDLLELDGRPTAGQHDDREGTIAMLRVLMKYVRSQIPGLELHAVRELVQQLGDLDSGIEGSLLAKASGGCRRKRSMSQYLMRIYSAAYLEALREAHVPLDEAMAKVSARLGSACRRCGLKLTKSTVVNWRKQLRRSINSAPRLDEIAAEHFDDILADWRPQGGTPTREDADSLAARLLARLSHS